MQSDTRGCAQRSGRLPAAFSAVLVLLVCVLGSFLQAGGQTIPNVVITTSQVLAPVNGNAGHVAVNAFGTVFWISATDKVVYELPLGATTPIAVVTGVQYATNVYVDRNNNLYVPNLYSGSVAQTLLVPFVSGTYATGVADVSASFKVCTSPSQVPCIFLNNGAGTTGYYLQVGDLASDAAGNFYVVDTRDNDTNGSANRILKFAAPVTSTTLPTLLADNLLQSNSAQIAADALGNVYYADGTSTYFIAAGTAKPTKIATTLIQPTGVSTDAYGDLFITDASSSQRIVELPANAAGVAQAGSQFNYTFNYSANGVAVDPQGRVFYTSYANSSTNISVMTPFGSFSSQALGTASAPLTFTAVFNSSQTATSIGLSGVNNGAFTVTPGTCGTGTAYSVGSNCTVIAGFTPNGVGTQQGAIVFAGASGNFATAYLSGTGLGAAQTADPGMPMAIGAGFKTPGGIAVDPAKNVYIADAAVNVVMRYAAGAATGTAVGTGLLTPTSVATDGAGNVYIADSGNKRIVEVPVAGTTPSNAAQSVVFTGTSGKTGIAIDNNGNLLVADSGNKRVLRVATVGGTPSGNEISVIGSGFVTPVAVTSDTVGDVFVADLLDTTAAKGTVSEVSPANTITAVSSSLSTPTGLALDASGSLYIADAGVPALLKVPFEKGVFNSNDQFTVGQAVALPYGVAIDSAGNLYVTDSVDGTVSEVVRTQGLLNLGLVNLNSTSTQLTAEISNSGNQALTFGTPLYTQTGTAAPFNITAPSGNGCMASSSLQPGFACTLAVTFQPVTKATFTDTLGFMSNAANTSKPQLTLTGTGTFLSPDTLVLSVVSPTGTIALDAPITVSAVVASTGAGTPTGMVQFFLGGNSKGTVPVVNGVATLTLLPPNGGPSTVAATYSGDTNFASAAAQPLTFTVARATTYTQFSILTVYYSPQSVAPGGSATLQATVFQNGLRAATQTVSFYNGTTLLGTTPVAAGVANLVTTTLPTGNLNVYAVYSGDVNYLGSTSSSVPLIVSPALFTITPSAPALTVKAGATGTLSLLATQISGYTGTIGLSVCGPNPATATCATGLPPNTVFSFNPNTFSLPSGQIGDPTVGYVPQPSSQQTTTMLVLTDQVPVIAPPGVAELRIPGTRQSVPISLAFLLLAPLGLFGRRMLHRAGKGKLPLSRLLLVLLALLAGAGAVTVSGCGSNNFFGTTPAATYKLTIVVTGATGTTAVPAAPTTMNIPFTLTVQ